MSNAIANNLNNNLNLRLTDNGDGTYSLSVANPPDLLVGAKSLTLTLSTGAGSVPVPDTAHLIGINPTGTHTLAPRVGLEAPEANGTKTGDAAAGDLKKGFPIPTGQWTYFNLPMTANRTVYFKGDASATFDVVIC